MSEQASNGSQPGESPPTPHQPRDISQCCETFMLAITGEGSGGAVGIQWRQARGAAKHPTQDGPPFSQQRIYPAPNVNSAEGEKPCEFIS